MGLIINLVPDASVADAPAGFAAAIEEAAQILENTITTNITVNIAYGWGTYDNVAEPSLEGVAEAEGGPLSGVTMTYAGLWTSLETAALLNGDPEIVAALPLSDTALPNDQNTFFVSTAEEKAFGIYTGSANAIDGAIGFGTGWTNPSEWLGAALHELTHAMGRMTDYYVGAPTAMDLYRFSAPGTYQWAGGQPAYFSIDDGVSEIANYDTVGDYSDWNNSSLTRFDAFNELVSSNSLSTQDLEELEAIGFGVKGSQPLVPMVDSVTVSPQYGDVPNGTFMQLTLHMSTAVLVNGGTPTLTLNNGGVATYDAGYSRSTSLVFDYVAVAGEQIGELAVTGISLNGASITDGNGDAASMAGVAQTFPGLSVNVPLPTITGALAGQQIFDIATIHPFAGVTIGDPYSGQTESVSVFVSAAANGTLSNLGSGSYDATLGLYSVSGSTTAVTAALQGLVFTPTPHQEAAGQTVTTTFAISDTDTKGELAYNPTTSVVAISSSVIETDGTLSLLRAGNEYLLLQNGSWVALYDGGALASVSGNAPWTPFAAAPIAGGYEVAWTNGAGEYTIWDTDSSGNYLSSPTGGAVAANDYALEAAETSFGVDLNSDGTIGLHATTLASNGITSLVQVANEYELEGTGGSGPMLNQGSVVVTSGLVGGDTPVGAVQTADGYEVAWKLPGGEGYAIWNVNNGGTFTGLASGILAGNSVALQIFETTFDEDLNGDGSIGPQRTTLASNGTISLVQIDDEYALDGPGGSTPLLQYQGAPVTTGEFGAFTPIGAAQTAGGYEVALSNGAGAIVVWDTDSNGNYVGSPIGQVAATSYALESLEVSFGEDLNNDGTIGLHVTTLVSNGTTSLVLAGNAYELQGSGGTGPILQEGGAPVTVGEFGAIAPVGALQTADGYEVAWNLGGGEYAIWNVGTDGSYTGLASGVMAGGSAALEIFESSFDEDLNGDGSIGPKRTTIASNGTLSLVQIDNEYALDVSGGGSAMLQYQGAPVTAGQFGAFTPAGAEQIDGGYEVAWSNGAGSFVFWDTDSNGNYVGSPAGALAANSYALESLETGFGEDLNHDGTIGLHATTLASNGVTSLVLAGNEYELQGSGGSGPILQEGGAAVTVGEFGAIAPVGALQTADGYQVAWNLGGGQYAIWNVGTNGAFVDSASGVLSGGSMALETFETTFNEDLNGDGSIGPPQRVIASNGTTTLMQVGDEYGLYASGGTGPTLQEGGAPVTAGEFGALAPIGAVRTGSGYQVAWSLGGNEYAIWNVNSDGSYASNASGALAGNSLALQMFETTFNEDLNGDGIIGPQQTTIASNGVTSLVQLDGEYAMEGSGGSSVILQYDGAPVTVGEFGAVTPIAAAQVGDGYDVAFKAAGSDQYVVWTTDGSGNYLSSPTGTVSGESFALENLEPIFGEDINGDGRLSSSVVTSGTAGVVNLALDTSPVTVDLGSNSASAAAGLNAASLTFIGSPDAITLTPGLADTVEYALAPASGIETIANFTFGTDELNIDLMGASSMTLKAYDTTVGGVHAIALASASDALHGVVLLNMTGGVTAASLLSSHTTFAGGHALIT